MIRCTIRWLLFALGTSLLLWPCPTHTKRSPSSSSYSASSRSSSSAPNILYIMADDLGWGNVGFHNTEDPLIRTPNMDALVADGLHLTRHYVSPLCSPSDPHSQYGRTRRRRPAPHAP